MSSQGLSAAGRGIAGQKIGMLNPGNRETEYRAIGVWLTQYKSVSALKYDKNHIRLLLYTPLCPLPIWSPACVTLPDKPGFALIETIPFKLTTWLNLVNIVAADYVNHDLCSVEAKGLSVPLEYDPHTIQTIRYLIPIRELPCS